MEQIFYQRPREKLQSVGASSLTLIELLQIVLSPGNAQLSSAKLARIVEPFITSGKVSYAHLTALHGVGHAKACQILALVELCERVYRE